MKLLASRTSPYARKIRVVAHLLDITDKIDVEFVNPFDSPPSLVAANPLSKVPALVLDSHASVVGSALITDYLTAHYGGESILPQSGEKRWEILRHAAMAEGIIDAAVGHVFESRRPADKQQSEKLDRFYQVIRATITTLNQATLLLSSEKPTDFGITFGVALAYLDFRHKDQFSQYIGSEIYDWYSGFSQLPCMLETAPPTD